MLGQLRCPKNPDDGSLDLDPPYKPKRRTRAAIARERGLGPLAEAILTDRSIIARRIGPG